jgi:hypothetical protein
VDGLLKYKQSWVYVLECKLRLFIFKEKYDSPIAGHKDEKSRYSSIIKVILAAPKEGYSPLCEKLGWMSSEPNLLPQAKRPLATIAYPAGAMAL